MQELKLAIAGAGIGGLTAALALQKLGFRPIVYEQATALGEIGAGLTLAPNATRVLRDLDLFAALTPSAVMPEQQVVRHFATGHARVVTPRGAETLARYGAPYWQVHRADLHAALAHAVQSQDAGCLRLGHELIGVTQSGNRVRLDFANGADIDCDLLAAGDGIRSRVREQLHQGPAPRFMGYVAWRGLVPAHKLDDPALSQDAAIYIGPDRMLAHYPVRAGALVNCVAYARQADWGTESWTARAAPQEVVAAFQDFHPQVLTLLAALPAEECFKWALYSREPLEQWTQGRVTLLGDAAHPTLPFLGQGANMAIEDGMVLARALKAATDAPTALALYESARRERCALVMRRSIDAVNRFLSPHPERFDASQIVSEEKLGLFNYDAVNAPL